MQKGNSAIMKNKRILYLTDLCYRAKGRNYSEEDIYITNKLKESFDVVLCHPKCAESFEDMVDLIVFRNTGSVIEYKDVYQEFISTRGTACFLYCLEWRWAQAGCFSTKPTRKSA